MLELLIGIVIVWLVFGLILMYPARWLLSKAKLRKKIDIAKYEDSLKASAALLVVAFVFQGLRNLHLVLFLAIPLTLVIGCYFFIYKKVVWWRPVLAGVIAIILATIASRILALLASFLV